MKERACGLTLRGMIVAEPDGAFNTIRPLADTALGEVATAPTGSQSKALDHLPASEGFSEAPKMQRAHQKASQRLGMFDHSLLIGLSRREQVQRLHSHGYAPKKIAKVLGVAYPLVQHWLSGGTLSKREFFERQRSGAIQAVDRPRGRGRF